MKLPHHTRCAPSLEGFRGIFLDRLAAGGLIEAGLAQRVRLLAELTATLPSGEPRGAGEHPSEPGEAVSGQALGERLGLSRAGIHKHVGHLRALGFAIESVTGLGYRLAAPFDDLLAAEAVLPFILEGLAADQPRSAQRGRGRADAGREEPGRPLSQPEQLLGAAGWAAGIPYVYRESCDSTNKLLRDLAEKGAAVAGTTVVTDHQSKGRGRLDRVWRDQAGKDLMFSVLLRPALAPGQAHLLSLAAALAVAETVEELGQGRAPARVKWPNDVVVEGRKICGILLAGSMDGDRLHWVIAGIGVNVNSDCAVLADEIAALDEGGFAGRPHPVSLRDLLGARVPRAPLLAALLRRLTVRWTELERPEGAAAVLAGLRRRDALAGQPVEVVSGDARHQVLAAGEAAGFGPEGQLLVRLPSGEITAVFAGDVTLSKGSSQD